MKQTAELLVDETKFDRLSELFVTRFITTLVRSLVDSGRIELDHDNPTQDDTDLVFSMSFILLGQLEEQGGFELGADKFAHYSAFLFAPSAPRLPTVPSSLIVSKERTNFHGRVSDELVANAIRMAKR